MALIQPAVCFCSIAFRDQPVEALIPRLARLGYDGIEIWGGQIEHRTPDELAAIRRLCVGHGLRIAAISPYFWLTRDLPELLARSFATAERFVAIAHALAGPDGPPLIRTFVDAGPDGIGSAVATPAQWARAVGALRRITALDRGVGFAVETHINTLADTPASAQRLLAAVDAPNLCINYQPAEGDPVPGWRLLRPAVRHLHLQGPHGPAGGGYLEDGGHRLPELLAALRADGYAGTLSVEYCWQGATWERAASARDWLRAQGF